MTTNLNRSQSKTRDRHSAEPTRRTSRPTSEDGTGTRSADEIRENVKEAVGKGVAAVAGAVEGVAETMEETHLAKTAEEAIHQVGGTANKVVRAAKEETTNLKHAFAGEADSPMEEDEEDPIGKNDPTFPVGEGLSRSTLDPSFQGTSLQGSSSGASFAGSRPSYDAGSSYGTEASSDGSPLGAPAARSLRDEDDEDEPVGL